jgi:hypothetical protein
MSSSGTLARVYAYFIYYVSRLLAQTLPSFHYRYGEITAAGAD